MNENLQTERRDKFPNQLNISPALPNSWLSMNIYRLYRNHKITNVKRLNWTGQSSDL